MANGLSFLPIQDETEDIGGGVAPPAAASPEEDLVAQLLASLDLPQAPERPNVGVGRRIAGTLGDALTAFASVQAGGRPPFIGSFAAGQRADEQAFQQERIAAEAERRGVANRIRIGEFARRQDENRRIRIRQEEAEIQKDLESERRVLDSQARLRASLQDRIINLGVEGVDLLTASEDEMLEAIGSRDPEEELQAMLDSVPEGMEVDAIDRDASGRYSVRLRNVDSGRQPFSPTALVRAAEQGVALTNLAPDKQTADALTALAKANVSKSNKAAALRQYDDAIEIHRENSTTQDLNTGELRPNIVSLGLVGSLDQLKRLINADASNQELTDFYLAEVAEAVGMVAEDTATMQQAEEFLSILREHIIVGARDFQFPAISIQQEVDTIRQEAASVDTAEEEAAPARPETGLAAGLSRSAEGISKGLDAAMRGIMTVLSGEEGDRPLTNKEKKELKGLMDRVSNRLGED
jgi:hypothetical protein